MYNTIMKNMFYNRKIYPNIKEHLSNKQITVITGMRRVGKTTIVNKLLAEIDSKNKVFFDLQKISNQELFAQKNYDNIILDLRSQGIKTEEKIYLAIDEIQLLPEIAGTIKYLYDHYDIKFIVTGSSSYYLKNLFSESLSGRKKIFELYPLDFGEFLEFKQVKWAASDFLSTKFSSIEYERLKNFYEEYLEFGGFPEVVLLSTAKEKRDLLSDIISSYLNIDIKNLSDFRDSQNLYNLIKMLAARVGTKLDYSKLASLSGLSRLTVVNYVNLFEKTYLISRVPVHTKNIDREIVKARKIYFNDNGFLNILADLSGGAKFENAVFNQLKAEGDLRYYSLKNGREIDFVLNSKTALEAKENPTDSDLKTLAELSETAGLPEHRLIGRYQSVKFADYIWGGEIK
jgi:Predicted ATPase (AAA+ superfamily)